MKYIYTLLFLVILSSLNAHEIAPSIINFKQIDKTNYSMVIDTNIEAMILEIGNKHIDTKDSPVSNQYDILRSQSSQEVKNSSIKFINELSSKINFFDGSKNNIVANIKFLNLKINDNEDLKTPRESQIIYNVSFDKPVDEIGFSWNKSLGDAIFRVTQNNELLSTLWVKAGTSSNLVKFNDTKQEQSWSDYIIIGFKHILPLGVDHILFVIGLYLLSQKLSALLWQVTAFTVAHTITLALATLEIFTLPSYIVEPLIAASIAYVAIENLYHHHITKFRIFLVFTFGLLHGMGFAGALGEIGLDENAFIASLISFNVGVELGQLAVIIGMFILFQSWLGKTKYWEKFFKVPVSIAIAVMGIFWFIQRVWEVI